MHILFIIFFNRHSAIKYKETFNLSTTCALQDFTLYFVFFYFYFFACLRVYKSVKIMSCEEKLNKTIDTFHRSNDINIYFIAR